MDSQSTTNEQQQPEDQGHGSSQADSNEGRSGLSSVSQYDVESLEAKKVLMFLKLWFTHYNDCQRKIRDTA